jgi:NAD(P)H-dependent FMN reductase
MKRVVGIVGSYRKNGTIDQAIDAVLEGAREKGAETDKIYLTDHPIEFCTNCRQCTQKPGETRDVCVQNDGLEDLLRRIESSDAIVLGSPVNYYNVTAIFRRFLERLLGSVYWPWGQAAPKGRDIAMRRKAVLIASSAAPGIFIPIATGASRALRIAAKMLGAKTVGHMWIGLVAMHPQQELTAGRRRQARRLGWKLA